MKTHLVHDHSKKIDNTSSMWKRLKIGMVEVDRNVKKDNHHIVGSNKFLLEEALAIEKVTMHNWSSLKI